MGYLEVSMCCTQQCAMAGVVPLVPQGALAASCQNAEASFDGLGLWYA